MGTTHVKMMEFVQLCGLPTAASFHCGHPECYTAVERTFTVAATRSVRAEERTDENRLAEAA